MDSRARAGTLRALQYGMRYEIEVTDENYSTRVIRVSRERALAALRAAAQHNHPGAPHLAGRPIGLAFVRGARRYVMPGRKVLRITAGQD